MKAAPLLSLLLSSSLAAHAASPTDAGFAVPTDSLPSSSTDSLATAVDSVPIHHSKTLWIKQLLDNGFHINDPDVDYPRFPRFLVKVYNWGDRTFNSYDPEYVRPTGKNWKLVGKSFNWLETMNMSVADQDISMHTHFYADAGISLSFMAVSLSWTFNVNELLGVPTRRSSFNFDFTCSRFTINMLAQSYKGDMTITRLANYNDGHHVSIPFNDADNRAINLDAIYFFNHRRYSHAAAYCYSKYQLRSAGTWMAGFAYSSKNVDLNLRSIANHYPDLDEYLQRYQFRYNDYQAIGGYAYNWAIKPPRWVLNATGLISMGYRRSFSDDADGKKNMIANGFRVNLAAVYNHRKLFLSMNSMFRGSLLYTGKYLFFNCNMQFYANIGMRF